MLARCALGCRPGWLLLHLHGRQHHGGAALRSGVRSLPGARCARGRRCRPAVILAEGTRLATWPTLSARRAAGSGDGSHAGSRSLCSPLEPAISRVDARRIGASLAQLRPGSYKRKQLRRPVADNGLDVIAQGLGGDLRIARRQRVAHHAMLLRAGRQASPVVRRHAQGAVAEGVAMHMQRATSKDRLERREACALEDGEVELAVELAQGVAVVPDFGFGDMVDNLVEASEVVIRAGFGRATGALGLQRDADARHLGRFLQRGSGYGRPVIAAACDQSVLLEPQQRLAHWSLAATHRRRDLLFQQSLSRLDPAQQDRALHRVIDGVALALLGRRRVLGAKDGCDVVHDRVDSRKDYLHNNDNDNDNIVSRQWAPVSREAAQKVRENMTTTDVSSGTERSF